MWKSKSSPDREKDIDLIKDKIETYPDFPKPGILFRDIFPIFTDPHLLGLLRNILAQRLKSVRPPIDCIAGLDARGFLLGPLVSLELQLPFIPIRKTGKLPGNVIKKCYKLEYNSACLELQLDALRGHQRIAIVDDILATGGTMGAACNLIMKAGAEVTVCLVVIELDECKGRENVPAEVVSLIQYN